MDSKNYDWSKFTTKISINASFEIIYQAWTVQENIEKWFLAKAEFKTPDGKLRKQNQQIQEVAPDLCFTSHFRGTGKQVQL